MALGVYIFNGLYLLPAEIYYPPLKCSLDVEFLDLSILLGEINSKWD